MRNRPDTAALMDAVAGFLAGEVRSRIEDPGIGFRVLIAAHLASVVAGEARSGAERNASELARLRELLGPDDFTDADPRAVLLAAYRKLAAKIRQGGLDAQEHERIWAHVRKTLVDELATANPRFDTEV